MVIDLIGWSFVTAVAAWGITLSWAKLALARTRASMADEIRYWHAEATKARELVAQLKHEIAIWSKGCQQGREDVMAIMPLLVATQDRLTSNRLAETTEV
jgi:hypothetical protein